MLEEPEEAEEAREQRGVLDGVVRENTEKVQGQREVLDSAELDRAEEGREHRGVLDRVPDSAEGSDEGRGLGVLAELEEPVEAR